MWQGSTKSGCFWYWWWRQHFRTGFCFPSPDAFLMTLQKKQWILALLLPSYSCPVLAQIDMPPRLCSSVYNWFSQTNRGKGIEGHIPGTSCGLCNHLLDINAFIYVRCHHISVHECISRKDVSTSPCTHTYIFVSCFVMPGVFKAIIITKYLYRRQRLRCLQCTVWIILWENALLVNICFPVSR